MRSKLIVIAAVVLVSGGCNRPDADHAMADPATSTGAVISFITPPAAPERGPIPPDANAAAPGTNASLAFADSSKVPPSERGAPDDQQVALAAQEAAAKAPDTAAADAAKRKVYEEFAEGGTAGGEAAASAPLGPLTTPPESGEMPMPGQANDESSAALDKPLT